MAWKKAIVVRFHSNMVTVQDLETRQRVECYLRGKFKIQKIRPIVGDYVEYSAQENGNYGTIENILPRKNQLFRPTVANIDQVVLVTTLKDPKVDLLIVDKFLVQVEKEKLEVIIVLNKMDLINSQEEKNKLKEFLEIYKPLYPIICTSKITKENIDLLKSVLKGKISTFAGLSGVGKSSLLNLLDPQLNLKVGEISKKLKRGKHTTTYGELLYLDFGGFIVDTPGFANLELESFDKDEIKYYFIEFLKYQPYCTFTDCSHTVEPDCAVKAAVEKGDISLSRYNNYCIIYRELNKWN